MLYHFEFKSIFYGAEDLPNGETYVEADDIIPAIELFRERLGPSNYFRIQNIRCVYEEKVHRRENPSVPTPPTEENTEEED
jgi:hypothetical protein